MLPGFVNNFSLGQRRRFFQCNLDKKLQSNRQHRNKKIINHVFKIFYKKKTKTNVISLLQKKKIVKITIITQHLIRERKELPEQKKKKKTVFLMKLVKRFNY